MTSVAWYLQDMEFLVLAIAMVFVLFVEFLHEVLVPVAVAETAKTGVSM